MIIEETMVDGLIQGGVFETRRIRMFCMPLCHIFGPIILTPATIGVDISKVILTTPHVVKLSLLMYLLFFFVIAIGFKLDLRVK